MEYFRTKHALGRKLEEDILSLPEVEEPRVVAAMQITYLMFPLLAGKDLSASPLVASRLVQMTLQYGLNEIGMSRVPCRVVLLVNLYHFILPLLLRFMASRDWLFNL